MPHDPSKARLLTAAIEQAKRDRLWPARTTGKRGRLPRDYKPTDERLLRAWSGVSDADILRLLDNKDLASRGGQFVKDEEGYSTCRESRIRIARLRGLLPEEDNA